MEEEGDKTIDDTIGEATEENLEDSGYDQDKEQEPKWLRNLEIKLETVRRGLSRRIDNMVDDVFDLIEALEKERDEFKEEIKELNNALEKSAKGNKTKERDFLLQVKELQREITHQGETITSLTGKVQSLEGRIGQLQDNCKRNSKGLAEINKKTKESNTSMSVALEKASAMVTDNKKTIEETTDTLERTKRDLEEAKEMAKSSQEVSKQMYTKQEHLQKRTTENSKLAKQLGSEIMRGEIDKKKRNLVVKGFKMQAGETREALKRRFMTAMSSAKAVGHTKIENMRRLIPKHKRDDSAYDPPILIEFETESQKHDFLRSLKEWGGTEVGRKLTFLPDYPLAMKRRIRDLEQIAFKLRQGENVKTKVRVLNSNAELFVRTPSESVFRLHRAA